MMLKGLRVETIRATLKPAAYKSASHSLGERSAPLLQTSICTSCMEQAPLRKPLREFEQQVGLANADVVLLLLQNRLSSEYPEYPVS